MRVSERESRQRLLAGANNISNASIEQMKRAIELLGERLSEMRVELVGAVESIETYPESFHGFHHKVDLLRDHMRELIRAMNKLHEVQRIMT